MSLDDDLYTIFNTGWRTANIRKPTFYTSAKITSKGFGDFYIQTNRFQSPDQPGDLTYTSYQRDEYFELTFFEGSEANIATVENEVFYLLAADTTANTVYEIYESEPVNHQNKLYWKILRGRRRQWVTFS